MIPIKGRLGVAATRLSRKRPREITERSERPHFVRIAARCVNGTRNSADFLDSSIYLAKRPGRLSSCRNRIESNPRPRMAFRDLFGGLCDPGGYRPISARWSYCRSNPAFVWHYPLGTPSAAYQVFNKCGSYRDRDSLRQPLRPEQLQHLTEVTVDVVHDCGA